MGDGGSRIEGRGCDYRIFRKFREFWRFRRQEKTGFNPPFPILDPSILDPRSPKSSKEILKSFLNL